VRSTTSSGPACRRRAVPGTLYPRWFPDSFEGLGSTTFYFYPPLAFWLKGALAALGLGASHAVALAATAFSAASGLAMYGWLKDRASRPLWWAVIYMSAPYQLYDFYLRGALAEYASHMWFPLIA